MSEYIEQRNSSDDVIIHLSKNAIKRKSFLAVRKVSLLLTSSIFLFLISPLFGFFFLFYALITFYNDIYMQIFMKRRLFERYYSFFSPALDASSLAIVGYRVEWDEIEEHIAMISGEDEKVRLEKMRLKQAEMMLEKNRERWVGFGKSTLTTHIIMNGKTGSGKTEGIRSIMDSSMRSGGGIGMNDGKSDEKMLVEIGTQAKANNRETSLRVLNYLKGEKLAESNTLNPIAMMHPIRSVEFLGSLVEKGGGDGTQQYFFNRGKVLLSAPISALSIRRELTGEPFDFDRVMEFRNIKAFVVMELMFYCMCRDLNAIIANNKTLVSRLNAFRSTFSDVNLKHLHSLVDYVTQNPLERSLVERELNFPYRTIKEIYSNTYLLLKNYLDGVWNQYNDALDSVGKILYIMGKNDKKVFFSTDKRQSVIGFESFRRDYYNVLKETIENVTSDEKLKNVIKSGIQHGLLPSDFPKAKDALLRKKAQGGNIEDIPDDAVQQHAYASQQWDELSKVFTQYKHIFGQTRSEINPNRLMLDNKILYVLIPVLELSDDFIQILGKMTVMLIREVAAIALAGEKISIHNTIKRIMKDQVTPKPFSLEVLDEYNSYPINNIDKLLMQLRSLNVSMVLGIQNFAGLKAGGDNQTSQENALGNATKWFTKTEDETAIKWIREMIGEDTVLKTEFQVDSLNNVIDTANAKVESVKVFKAEKIRDFESGFSIILAGSNKNKIIPMQSFYRGGKSETIHIKRFTPLVF